MKYTEEGHDGESNLGSWEIITKRYEGASKISHYKSDDYLYTLLLSTFYTNI